MKISARLESVLLNRSFPYHNKHNTSRKANIYGTDLNTRFLRTINENNTFIVPACMLSEFVNSNGTKNIVYPLSIGFPYHIKSLDSMIISILKYPTRTDAELMRVISEKYGIYYGTEGLILDESFNILLMNAYKCTVRGNKVYVESLITYVHPTVSLSETNVNKYIYTKIVPYYINSTVYNNAPFNTTSVESFSLRACTKVLFEDITNDFLVKAITPSADTDEEIHSVLSSSIEDIMETIKNVSR